MRRVSPLLSPRSLRLAGAALSLAVVAGACSSAGEPEALPMADEVVTSEPVGLAPETDVDPATGLSDEQQSLLDGCATAIEAATTGIDTESPTYSADLAAAVMAPEGPVADACSALLDPESGIDPQVGMQFMIAALPPELLGQLSTLVPDEGLGGATLESLPDTGATDTGGASSGETTPG